MGFGAGFAAALFPVFDAPLTVGDSAFPVFELFVMEEVVLVLGDAVARDLFLADELGAARCAAEGVISLMFIP